MAFSPDGRRLAVALSNLDAPGPVLRLFELREDPPIAKTFGPLGCSCALAFSPDGERIAIAGVFGASPENPSFVSVIRLEDQIVLASHKDIRPHRASLEPSVRRYDYRRFDPWREIRQVRPAGEGYPRGDLA